jgi:diguanylate cyclase (GGDEF)-like protein
VSTSGSAADRRVWQLSAAMTAVAVAVAAPRLDLSWPPPSELPVLWLALVPAFALAEIVVIHLPAQRSSHSHTLREIPAIVGLTFLATGEYLAAYLVGGALALVFWTHQKGLKLVFNLSMFALEASVGSLAYEMVLGSGTDPIAPRAWGAALLAVLVTDLLSAAAVTAAISLTEGNFDRDVLEEALRSGIPAAMVNTCVALLCVTLIIARPSALPLLGAVVVILVLGYRVYIGLARGYARTQQLYEFVEATGRTAELEDAVPAILRETAKLLRAERVQIVVSTDHAASIQLVTWEGGQCREESTDWRTAGRLWWGPALSGRSVLLSQDQQRESRDGFPREGIAVAMRDDIEVIGVLHVAERSFGEETFGSEDLRLFEALAAHATVALSKARAIERLKHVAEERRLEALHDPLTGLSNRRAFTEAMEQAMATSSGGAVLLLDLDDFKDVNDTLGHTAGDALLRVTGARLESETEGLVARLGGDEFAVLLPGASLTTATATANRLRRAIMRPVPMSDVELSTSASIGVAELPVSASSSDDVLAQADVAMYAAKEARSGVESYRAEDGDAIGRRLVLAADLARALPRGEVELWFQPQALMADDRISGFEALLRWSHPQFGWVPPPEIVAVAQRTGLARSLTDFILGEALRHRRQWAHAGFDVEVAVNVTPRDIADVSLVKRVTHALHTTDTAAASLVIEVTESDALGDPERAMGVLCGLSEAGVRLSVDDFGTGYSSLAYLERLPVDEVKIDQSFVFRLERNPSDSTIIRATVALAHDLGLRVIAEGVENDSSRGLVANLGCDVYQGFGLSRPLPADQVVPWLQRRTAYPSPSLSLVKPSPAEPSEESAAV